MTRAPHRDARPRHARPTATRAPPQARRSLRSREELFVDRLPMVSLAHARVHALAGRYGSSGCSGRVRSQQRRVSNTWVDEAFLDETSAAALGGTKLWVHGVCAACFAFGMTAPFVPMLRPSYWQDASGYWRSTSTRAAGERTLGLVIMAVTRALTWCDVV